MDIISILIMLFLGGREIKSLSKERNKVNGKKINVSLEEHYLMLLGLENQKGISVDTINDAFLLKIELLGNQEGETVYVNDLKAGRAYLLDTCNFKGALN